MASIREDILPFAALDHRLQRGRVFGIAQSDLSRHVYVIGKTGMGKSALLERLLVAQLRAGHGVGLIDPHGDLAERLLHFVPRARVNEVVYFNPADADFPVGLNLLEGDGMRDASRTASMVVSVLRKTFSEFWGPRLEHVLRNALLAVLETRGSTLLTVERLLRDSTLRERLVGRLKDPLVRAFWEEEFAQYPKGFAAEVLAPVQNKLGAALSSPLLRQILGAERSGFSPGGLMQGNGILIANLAKGRIGEDASRLLGTTLLGIFQLAAYRRADLSQGARTPFTLYVDEFQGFVTPSFSELLAEARKYGLGLVLAHQHLAQLDHALRQAVLGNAGTQLVFRVGAEDATLLGGEFEPELTAHDLTRLGRHQVAVRLCVDGVTSIPFTAVTLPPEDLPASSAADTIVRVSRERHAGAAEICHPRPSGTRHATMGTGVPPSLTAGR